MWLRRLLKNEPKPSDMIDTMLAFCKAKPDSTSVHLNLNTFNYLINIREVKLGSVTWYDKQIVIDNTLPDNAFYLD